MTIAVVSSDRAFRSGQYAFSFVDFLMTFAGLMLIGTTVLCLVGNARSRQRQAQCNGNLRQVTGAVLSFAGDGGGRLPEPEPGLKGPLWWFYKEQVKGYMGLRAPSSPADKVFACPSDRGYDDGRPFRMSLKADYGSYNFNGVNLPGMPNIAGKTIGTIKDPSRTLLMMEWVAHAPLSWHRSRTGKKNYPFYNNAESMVSFVDGGVNFIPIYYDGMNAAYTRDPIPGYKYKYSGD